MTDFFGADYHAGHDNIRKYCNRPFKDWRDMNDTIINNHNAIVKPTDRFFHLGDFALMSKGKIVEFLSRLNGEIYVIVGNHEKGLIRRDQDFNIIIRDYAEPFIEWAKDYYQLNINSKNNKNKLVVLSHYAMQVWNQSHRGSYMLHGHSHGTLPDDPCALSIDVGIDATAQRLAVNGKLRRQDYRPISFAEVEDIMEKKTPKPVDHHKGNG